MVGTFKFEGGDATYNFEFKNNKKVKFLGANPHPNP
jgi:hypothetical protein